MASQTRPFVGADGAPLPVRRDDIPILYEDEDEGEMGESNPHVLTDEIMHVGVEAHLAPRPGYRVFSNMNLYYLKGPSHPRTGSLPYVSPDLMIVVPFRDLGEDVSSYTIGEDGPIPESVAEILSKRSAQQRDLKEKVIVYEKLGIAEYMLVDPSAKFLPERLLLKRLQANGLYEDVQDPDGGITSRLGFRLILDSDGALRVLDLSTGKRYAQPREAQREADARLQAEQERRLEQEARLQAEQERRLEQEARLQAEHERRLEQEARLQAEQERRLEQEARLQAEERLRQEQAARRQAEEARLQAEQQLRALHEQLSRLQRRDADKPKES